MRKRRWFSALIFVIPAVLAVATFAVANEGGERNFRAGMIGYQEVPAISTLATGSFQAELVDDNTLSYQLTYSASELGVVTQAHIHLGQRTANGAIVVFLCSNLGNGPAGTQACPPSGGVSGTITSANVLAAQGIAAGEFDELVRALRAGVAYANVHSTTFPGGEFRGQINDRDQRGDDDD
ncbi:MAG: CHRD domain-containing protein [Candidatus Limnocylindria bacterium]